MLSVLLAAALVTVAPPAAASFITEIDTGGSEAATARVATDDGGLVVLGNLAFPPEPSAPFLARVDPDGSLAWHRTLEDPDGSSGSGLVLLPSGDLVATMRLFGRPSLVGFDGSGTLTWQRHVAGPWSGSYNIGTIALTAPGLLVTTGQIIPALPGSRFTWRATFDPLDGTLLDVVDLPYSSTRFSSAGGPGLAVAGDDVVIVQDDGAITRLDSAGAVLHDGMIGGGTSPFLDEALGTPDGGVVAIGGPRLSDHAVIKSDSAGAIEWAVEPDFGAQTVGVIAVAVLPDGSFIVGGTVQDVALGWEPWLGRIDPTGTTIDAVIIPRPTDEFLGHVAVSAAGHVAWAGLRGALPERDLLVGVVEPWWTGAPACVEPAAMTLQPVGLTFTPLTGDTTVPAHETEVATRTFAPVSAVDTTPCLGESGCRPDPGEPEPPCSPLAPLAPGAESSWNFCDDAIDRFALETCGGSVHVVETFDLGPLADTVLELWSDDCATLLASDDDGGAEPRTSRLEWTASRSETVHVVVRQADDSFGDEHGYSLRVGLLPLDAPGEASAPGARPLRIDADGAVEVLAFEPAPGATRHGLLAGDIGDWIADAAHAARE